jgi:hypothetical protein
MAEVMVFEAIAEHEIDCGQHRAGDGENGFLRAAPTLDAEELGAQIAVLLARGGPESWPAGQLLASSPCTVSALVRAAVVRRGVGGNAYLEFRGVRSGAAPVAGRTNHSTMKRFD